MQKTCSPKFAFTQLHCSLRTTARQSPHWPPTGFELLWRNKSLFFLPSLKDQHFANSALFIESRLFRVSRATRKFGISSARRLALIAQRSDASAYAAEVQFCVMWLNHALVYTMLSSAILRGTYEKAAITASRIRNSVAA